MAGPLNWLSQVASVTRFGLLSIPQRRGAAASCIVGIAGVVAVLVGVLSILVGFRKTMAASGSPDAAIVLRTGATSEMVSGFLRENTRVISDAPGLARSDKGAIASPELFVIINLPKRSTGTDANVPLRGVEEQAFRVRERFKLVEGRLFQPGKNEVIVGTGAASQFAGLTIGNEIQVGRFAWPVVGVFSAGGGAAESEIWTDASVLQGAYHRGDTFQSVYAKLNSSSAFQQFKDAVTSDPRLNATVLRQTDYYAEQSSSVTKLITTLATIVVLPMTLGAIFGALITMYSAVSSRSREIATLRALGFGRASVVVSVLLESVLLALIGGVIGALLAYFAFDGFKTATMNFQSFSQVTFAFQVSPVLLVSGILGATFIGLFGGLFPAIRAARLPIASALREL